MLNDKNSDEHSMEDRLLGQHFTGEQATTFQQLLRLQTAIERQGRRVATAINPIAEALDTNSPISLEMMNHLRAQILLAHLQLDDLGRLLAAID